MKKQILLNNDEQFYTLIVVNPIINDDGTYDVGCPKNLMGMNLDKALSSIKWWRTIIADKLYPAFIYDPDIYSIFKKDGSQDKELIDSLIKKYQGKLPITREEDLKRVSEPNMCTLNNFAHKK